MGAPIGRYLHDSLGSVTNRAVRIYYGLEPSVADAPPAPLPAQAIVGRIAARLREERYMWAGHANELPRASFGIAWFPIDGRDADALISTADARMYEDKARARTTRIAVAVAADAD